jgi:HPt (histidine-containing phosphotransfer) domain-containing protein
MDGDRSLLEATAELFLANSREWVDCVRRAAEAQDLPGMRRAAHKYKGAAGTLGLKPAAAAAAALEKLEAVDADTIGSFITRLERCNVDCCDALRELIQGVPCRF